MTMLSDAEIEQLESANKPQTQVLSDSDIAALEAKNAPVQQQQPQDTSLLTKFFGEATPAEMPWGERFKRIGTSAASGGLLGGAITAPFGGFEGAIPGMIGGGMGEILKQGAAYLGADQPTQIASEFVGSMASPNPMSVIKPAINLGAKFIPGRSGYALETLLRDAQAQGPNAVSEAVRAARSNLPGVQGGEQAMADLGQVITNADQTATKTLENALFENTGKTNAKIGELETNVMARIKAAKENAAKMNTAVNAQERNLHALAAQHNANLATTLEQGIGKGSTPFELGSKIRNDVVGNKSSAYSQKQAAYRAEADKALASSAENEAQGNFWAGEAPSLAIRDKWLKIAEGSEEGVKKDIANTINQIWGKKTVTKQPEANMSGYGSVMPQAEPVTETVDVFAPATKVEQLIRKLGQVYEKEAPEGFKGIGAKNARDLRRDLTQGIEGQGGFYDWSGFGAAKEGFKTASKDMQDFETKRARSLVEKQFGTDRYVTDAGEVIPKLFKTPEGIQELNNLVRDPKKVAEYVDDYVRGELRGASPAKATEFTNDPANKHIFDQYPNLKQEITDYAGKAGILERQANKANEMVKSISGAKQNTTLSNFTTKAKSELESTKTQLLAELQSSNKALADSVQTSGLLSGGEGFVNPQVIMKKLLASDPQPSQLTAIAQAVAGHQGASKKLLDSAAAHISTTPPVNALREFDRILPVLQGIAPLDATAVTNLRNAAQKIVEASQKTKADPTPMLKKLFSKDNLLRIAGGQAGGQVTNRLFSNMENKNERY